MAEWKRVEGATAYQAGAYEIEQVWAPGPKGYGWYATGPAWDGGYYDSLTAAKADCKRHAAEAAEAALV